MKMLLSDAQGHNSEHQNILSNNETINNEVISEIEKELIDDPYDLVSLVFLLYDVPDTALQRLIVFQRISKDVGCSTNLNMLHEWFQHAKNTHDWKHKFLEALAICQLNCIIRKLGLNIQSVKRTYEPDNLHAKTYINPVRKALYRLCEGMDSNNFNKLKKTLLTYGIDTKNYETCELVLLELMCQKFITVSQYQYDKNVLGYRIQLDKLIKIVENIGLQQIAVNLRTLQQKLNDESKPNLPTTSGQITPTVNVNDSKKHTNDKYYNKNFVDTFDMIGQLHLDETINENLKFDTIKLDRDSYSIKNPKRVGICAIINQEDFYPSKHSLENPEQCIALEKRIGSANDLATLEKTMKWLNFEVISTTNIDHKEMFEFIKDVTNKFTNDDSIFILCILSHGVRGHVYAADSVKVKMEDIQNLIDSDDTVNLHDKPKLIIVQACQVDERSICEYVADGPRNALKLKKTNFLIYWATAPELEAYRSEEKGSVFIQILCQTIAELAMKNHALDIFTKVTNNVTGYCTSLQYIQVPLFQSTLRKNLYLQIPKFISNK